MGRKVAYKFISHGYSVVRGGKYYEKKVFGHIYGDIDAFHGVFVCMRWK